VTEENPEARPRISMRRGILRLAVSLAVVWLVFWNFAYVMHPYSSLIPEPASFAIRVTAWSVVVPCLTATLLLGYWVAVGFRSIERRRLT
jgi:hypothetical protein